MAGGAVSEVSGGIEGGSAGQAWRHACKTVAGRPGLGRIFVIGAKNIVITTVIRPTPRPSP